VELHLVLQLLPLAQLALAPERRQQLQPQPLLRLEGVQLPPEGRGWLAVLLRLQQLRRRAPLRRGL
jgi:hypothetical protein